MEPTTLMLAFAGIALGGFLKGATGAGAPVVGVPVLALVFNVPMAVAIFSVLNLVSNIWQAWAFRREVTDRYLVWAFAAGGAVGAIIGSVLLATLPIPILMATLAGVVFGYIALRLARPDWHLAREPGRRLSPYVGLIGGVMQGAGGLSAPVSVTFLNALNLNRAEFIGTISVFFLAMSIFQVPTLIALDILTLDRLMLAAAAAIPMFLGMPLGSWAARYLSKRAFDRAILALLAIIAVKLIWDAVI